MCTVGFLVWVLLSLFWYKILLWGIKEVANNKNTIIKLCLDSIWQNIYKIFHYAATLCSIIAYAEYTSTLSLREDITPLIYVKN